MGEGRGEACLLAYVFDILSIKYLDVVAYLTIHKCAFLCALMS